MNVIENENCTGRAAEWLHLTNEAYAAEKFGVRSLARIAKSGRLSREFAATIDEQIEDEIRHTRGYAEFVKKARLPVSGFSLSVEKLVESLPNITLQLFVIQGLIEGFNIGLLQHRLGRWVDYPSRHVELGAYEDEERHVSNSRYFMEELRCLNGIIAPRFFNLITFEVVRLFARQTVCESPESFYRLAHDWRESVHDRTQHLGRAPKTIAVAAINSMHASRKQFIRAYTGASNAA